MLHNSYTAEWFHSTKEPKILIKLTFSYLKKMIFLSVPSENGPEYIKQLNLQQWRTKLRRIQRTFITAGEAELGVLIPGDGHIGRAPDEDNKWMIEDHQTSDDKLKLDQTAFCMSVNLIKILSHTDKQCSNWIVWLIQKPPESIHSAPQQSSGPVTWTALHSLNKPARKSQSAT